MCPIAPLGLHISDLGQSRDLSVRENPFLIIVQDSGQTSILDDLDYLEFKGGSSLTPLDSLSLRFLLGFPFLTFPNEFLRSLSPVNGRGPQIIRIPLVDFPSGDLLIVFLAHGILDRIRMVGSNPARPILPLPGLSGGRRASCRAASTCGESGALPSHH
jgi:hypothetical protein